MSNIGEQISQNPYIYIYIGDSYKLIKDIPDKSVDLVVIDPPYEFDMSGGAGAFGTKKRNYHNEYLSLYQEKGKSDKETEILRIKANADKHRENNIRQLSKGFDIELLDEIKRIQNKTNIYIWCSKAQIRKILDYYENYKCNIDILTWHKTNPIPTCNNTYLNDTEYLIFAREKGVKIYGSYHTKMKYYVTPANVNDKKLYKHPTIKPLDIIKNLIINSSKEGDTVLDCFMGSGTTGVACKELNRNFIGMEINEEYYNIAKDRIIGINEQEKLWR